MMRFYMMYQSQDLTRDLQNNPDHGTCVDQDRTT